MATQDFVTESEAANFAGVSSGTLSRFAEAGYLKVDTAQSGERMYCRNELSELFGIPTASRKSIEVSIVDERSSSVESDSLEQMSEDEMYHAEVLTTDEITSEKPGESSESTDKLFDPIEYVTPKFNTPILGNQRTGEIEIVKLQGMIRLQDKVLDMKEEEVRALRKECEWLRSRIERHEEKSDRDQLLLLAETQLIRKFVIMQTQKKPSPLRTALEWIGLVPPIKEADLALPSANNPQIVEQK